LGEWTSEWCKANTELAYKLKIHPSMSLLADLKAAKTHVMQFKVSLKEISPEIWRRIQVPATFTFWDLHVAIQDAMGWQDYHLHQFTLKCPGTETERLFGNPGDENFDGGPKVVPSWENPIADHFNLESPEADYWYDFGDDWNHALILEEILPKDSGKTYPACLDGARACPPEDCGGVGSYEEMLEAIKLPHSEEAREYVRWLGYLYEPEAFDPSKVRFTSSKRRLRLMLER